MRSKVEFAGIDTFDAIWKLPAALLKAIDAVHARAPSEFATYSALTLNTLFDDNELLTSVCELVDSD